VALAIGGGFAVTMFSFFYFHAFFFQFEIPKRFELKVKIG
jgi:hypothetical protein